VFYEKKADSIQLGKASQPGKRACPFIYFLFLF